MKTAATTRPIRIAAMIASCLAAIAIAAGCVVENPPPPPPPPPPPALPQGAVIQPSSLAEDSRGNLWFTILGIGKIGSIDATGKVTEIKLPPVSFAASIVSAPDGNLWMVGVMGGAGGIAGSFIRTTPAGASTLYDLPNTWVPEGLALGPDGNLWFTAWEGANPAGAVAVGRLTMAGAITMFPLPEHGTGPATIASGPERSLWFTESPVARIGRVALDGKVFEYRLRRANALPAQITGGPDGNVWFTLNFSNRLARITPAGEVTEFTLPLSGQYQGIAVGSDRNLWIAVNHAGAAPGSSAGAIVRVTTSGVATVFPLPRGADVTGLLARRDGTLTFTERWVTGGPTYLGRITTAGEISESRLALNP